jgi:serine/threonine protein kinase
MGIVCLAHDPVMNRDLALKTILLPHGLPADEKLEYQKRFLREAQAAGRLSHPGIVTIYDFKQEEDDALPYAAMEYVPGFTLHELIVREGALDSQWTMKMADTLAGALNTAHRAGVVHRDLKPANILVRESDGAAKITDFGIARVNASELTQSGTTYGSPAYMAPERIKGQSADARSDIYSLAVIMYEALCGQRPFHGEDYASLCYAIVNEAPIPIRTLQPELSIAFDAFFRRALSKDPGERYQDGDDFRKGLESVRLQQRRFETGAATLKLMTPSSEMGIGASPVDEPEPVPEPNRPSVDDNSDDGPRTVPWQWVAIGATAVLVALFVFVAGSITDRGDAESRVEAEVAAEGPAVVAESEPSSTSGATTGASGATTAEPDSSAAEPSPDEVAKALEHAKPEPVKPPAPAPKKPAPPAIKAPVVAETTEEAPLGTLVEEAIVETEIGPRLPAGEFAMADEPLDQAETESVIEPIALGVNVKNNIKDGTLTLLVDGEEVFATDLSTDSGQKLKGALTKVLGKGQQVFEDEVSIPAGKHTITALAYSTAKDRQYETTLDVDLEPGDMRTLKIVAGRTLGRQLTLKID